MDQNKADTNAGRLHRGFSRNWVFVVIGLVTFGIIWYATATWGIAVEYDSVFYFTAAENLLSGNGLAWPVGGCELEPLTHYPPLYPILLAILKSLGLDITAGARFLSALLFGLSAGFLGWFVSDATSSFMVGVAASAIFLISPSMQNVHMSAMTEPLFLLLLMGALYFLNKYLKTEEIKFLVFSGLISGMAVYTRYIGIGLLVAGVVIITILGKGSWWRRIIRAVGYVFIGSIPIMTWLIRNMMRTGSGTNRVLSFHPPTYIQLRAAASTVSLWLLPESVPFLLRFSILIGTTILIGWLLVFLVWKKWRRDRVFLPISNPLIRFSSAAIIFFLVYACSLLTSLTFTDASTRLDDRILSPLFLSCILILAPLIVYAYKNIEIPGLATALPAVIAVFLFSFALRSNGVVQEMRKIGKGFTGEKWQSVEIIEVFKNKDLGGLIYSTEPLPMVYLTGRPAYWVPRPQNPVRSAAVEDFAKQVELMQERLKTPGSMLVIFYQSFYHGELPPPETYTDGLIEWTETDDGAIFIDPVNDP